MNHVERSEIPPRAGKKKPASEYNYTDPTILEQQQRLIFFLQQKGFAPDSQKMYSNYTGYFLSWSTTQGAAEATTYNDLLRFINYCRKEGRSIKNTNLVLTSLRHYYSMLQVENNPAANLYLKGEVQRIPHDLLEKEMLDYLYEKYQVYNERTQRNKVILGLYIYQAISTDELKKLEPDHIKLKEGKIYIPGTKQTIGKGGRQARWLKLEAKQILDLQEYLLVTRPRIVHDITSGERKKQSTRKPNKINETALEHQLFISLNGSEEIKTSVRFLMEDLRKINPTVKDAMQIRKSVITQWLKEKDIRTVQYMAGHSSISTTERYRAANVEELEEALKIHHPLK
jgi:integrase/recombinase XerD